MPCSATPRRTHRLHPLALAGAAALLAGCAQLAPPPNGSAKPAAAPTAPPAAAAAPAGAKAAAAGQPGTAPGHRASAGGTPASKASATGASAGDASGSGASAARPSAPVVATPAPRPAGATPAASPGGPTPPPPPAPAGTAAAPSASAPAAANAPGATPPAPGGPPPFAVVTKDASTTTGLFTFWQKDDKVWLELRSSDFNKPFFLSPKLASGLGEGGVYAGRMLGGPHLVQWQRQHNLVQLVALNTLQLAKAGTPEGRAVAQASSNSLLTSVPVVSQPHPQRNSVLVDANALFVSDLLQISPLLQRAFGRSYGLERTNSTVTQLRGELGLSVVEVRNHYYSGAVAPNPLAAFLPVPAGPSGPRGLPDSRSLLLGLHYSLAALPDKPMAPRVADQRVGYFISVQEDYSDDLSRSPRQRYVNRWRLEKKDPAAELSEPVKPITYWIDRTVPLKYRDTVREGILEWNKAFERIGFRNAIVVQQQPDEGGVDTLDFGVASVRWLVSREAAFGAIGPSHVDPRTGEILDADIAIEGLSSRNIRTARASILGASSASAWQQLLQLGRDTAPLHTAAPHPGTAAAWAPATPFATPPTLGAEHQHDPAQCQHADLAGEQLSLGLDVLAAQGELEPDSPEAQAFVLAYLKDVVMHEVGHTLGLRHNFRASHVYSDRQVRDPAFTRTQAFTGSVMDYNPVNLPRPGEPAAAPFPTTLGPYDFWAIEYAYKPIAPADEKAELARIAGRSGEPELGFGTDEDNFLGVDPDALHMDLGDDPVAFAERRFDIAADLFKRQEAKVLAPGEDYARLRRSLLFAARDAARSSGILLRQIGGLRTLRDLGTTGRDPLQPVPAADQRAALALLTSRVLAPDSFALSPALQRRLAPDFFERAEGVTGQGTEFALADNLLGLQSSILAQLMSDRLAKRVLDNEALVGAKADALRLGELYQRLDETLWRGLDGRPEGSRARRNLQREHVNYLTVLMVRPAIQSRADARATVRQQATSLLARIERAQRAAPLDKDTRAHLQDCAESLRLALAAPMQRQSP